MSEELKSAQEIITKNQQKVFKTLRGELSETENRLNVEVSRIDKFITEEVREKLDDIQEQVDLRVGFQRVQSLMGE